MAQRQAFISIKDRKENFENNPKCRLINPAKNNLGVISKQILERMKNSITCKNECHQWRNTKSVIDWFSNIEEKNKHSFQVHQSSHIVPLVAVEIKFKLN